MKMKIWRKREIIWIILSFGLGMLTALFFKADLASFFELYYEQQVERKVMAVWRNSAAEVSYQECKDRPSSCLNKIVEWPVTNVADGNSYFSGNGFMPIVWRNKEQVPRTMTKAAPFQAVAVVSGVLPDAIELIFVGSSQAPFGGSTWTKKFGLDHPPVDKK